MYSLSFNSREREFFLLHIEIGSAYSKLVDPDDESLEMVREALSLHPDNYFFDPLYRSHKWDGYIHFFDKRGNKFPTGLLKDVLSLLGHDIKINDSRNIQWYDLSNLPNEIVLGNGDDPDIKLRPYQYEAVKDSLKKHTGIINAATNAGKTGIAAGIIQQLLTSIPDDQRIIFFTHSKEIYNQTIKRLEKRLNMSVGEIGSSVWKPKKVTVAMLPTLFAHLKKPSDKEVTFTGEYKVLKKLIDLVKPSINHNDFIALTNYLQSSRDSVDQHVAEYLVDIEVHKKDLKKELRKMKKALKKFIDKKLEKKMTKYDEAVNFLNSAYCVIVDECQRLVAKSFSKVLLSCSAPYRFGLSGTIDEDNEAGYMQIRSCVGDIIFKISNKYLIDHGFSAKPTVYFETIDRPLINNKNFPWQEVYKYGIEKNNYRNKKILNRVYQKYNSGESCLVIVNHIIHGEILDKLFHNSRIDSKFINGTVSDDIREKCLEEMKNGTLKVLIATNILDEGVDISGINCVFIASGGKSYRQVLQRVGRGLRLGKNKKTVEIYDYLDYTHPYLVEHTNDRFNYYKSEKFTIRYAR